MDEKPIEKQQPVLIASRKNISSNNQKKPVIKPVPQIGLYNKTTYNIHVVFKDCDIVIPPKAKTTKIYLQSDIISVQSQPLQKAIASGIVAVLR